MTTQPTNQPTNHRASRYRADAEYCLRQANIHIQEGDVAAHTQTGILAALCGIYDLLAELRDEDPEPRHRRELDEDDPDTLVEDDDTVEQPRFGLAYIPDNAAGYGPSEEPADRVRLSGFAAIHRHDDFGPPWGAA